MNKRELILLVIFLITFQAIAQKSINVTATAKEVGKNLLTNEPIKAMEYVFHERIHDFQIDTLNNALIIQLRGVKKEKWLANKGDVIRYDNENNRVLWSKNINYQTENIEQYGSIVLHTTGGKSYCLNNETGAQLWEVKNSLIFADQVDKIGIGYKIQPLKGKENTLEGIDLNTGKSIWQREIPRDYSWNNVFYMNDSTLLIAAAGLHGLNLFNGTGWNYSTITGEKDYTAAAVGTGLGIIAGLLTGTYAVSSGYNLVRDVASNVMVDSVSIYFASKMHLAKLTREGKLQWQISLPEDLTSRSRIFKHDSNLIMINMGYAYMGARQLDYGTPFIASFNLESGEENFLNTITHQKKEFIKETKRNDQDILFMFNDHISKYSLTTGELIINKQFPIEKYGELNYFLNAHQLYVQHDSTFFSLHDLDSTKQYIYTKGGKVLALNNNLEIAGEIESKDFYIYYLYRNKLRFIAKQNQTYVIDENKKKVAEFLATSESSFLNNKLYSTQEKSCLEIDLKNILNR